jgi:fucose permease
MAGIVLVLAIGVLFSPLPELKPSEANAGAGASGAASRRAHQHLPAPVAGRAVPVRLRRRGGDGRRCHRHLRPWLRLPLDQTKLFTSFTLGAMLAGYLAGLVLIPRFVSQERWLAFRRAGRVVPSARCTHGYVSVGFVAALGFANAMMWPAIFPLAIRGLGRFTETGSALLVMGIAGGAIIPQLFALLKQHFDFQLVFAALMVPCYLYILFYSLRGHRVGQTGAGQ